MEPDKRPFYLWIVILLANIGTLIFVASKSWSRPVFDLGDVLWGFMQIGISLSLSLVPVLIAKSQNKWKHYFGYGIPLLMLLTLPYFVYDYFTCTGKFCELFGMIFGAAFIAAAIIFTLFYTIGIQAQKRPLGFVLFVLYTEIIILGALVTAVVF